MRASVSAGVHRPVPCCRDRGRAACAMAGRGKRAQRSKVVRTRMVEDKDDGIIERAHLHRLGRKCRPRSSRQPQQHSSTRRQEGLLHHPAQVPAVHDRLHRQAARAGQLLQRRRQQRQRRWQLRAARGKLTASPGAPTCTASADLATPVSSSSCSWPRRMAPAQACSERMHSSCGAAPPAVSSGLWGVQPDLRGQAWRAAPRCSTWHSADGAGTTKQAPSKHDPPAA